ncbi:MAG: DUF5908 family protein [bacterium]
MPIEIRELNIRVVVSNEQNQGNHNGSSNTGIDKAAKKEIIAECIEQVMELLQQKKER